MSGSGLLYADNGNMTSESQAKPPDIITVKNGEGLAKGVGVRMREYTIYTKDPGAPMEKVMQHEAGHAFRLNEQYSRSTNLPYEGKENDIMGSLKMELLQSKTLKI